MPSIFCAFSFVRTVAQETVRRWSLKASRTRPACAVKPQTPGARRAIPRIATGRDAMPAGRHDALRNKPVFLSTWIFPTGAPWFVTIDPSKTSPRSSTPPSFNPGMPLVCT